MLTFLRKYQGIVLAIVGASLILPFTFFGTYRAFHALERKKDVVVAQAIDGSKMFVSEIQLLGQLLSLEQGSDTCFRDVFLRSGMAERVAEVYADALREEWKGRFDRAKRSRFYVHPFSPLINARALWNQFAPGLVEHVNQLQECSEVPSDFFSRWVALYLMQEKCPADLIRRILFYQQNQTKNIQPDPHLLSESFALFGYQSARDWFGRDWFELLAQVVWNGAALAEREGVRCSDADVERDLTKRFVSKEGDLLRAMGARQSDAVRVWKKVLLFTSYLRNRGDAQEFGDAGEGVNQPHERAHVECYTLPVELQMRSWDDLLAFYTYSKRVCRQGEGFLPEAFLSEEEIEKRAPELLMTRYRVRLQEVDLQKIAARIPLTELWSWQVAHWDRVRHQFPQLRAAPEGARIQLLEALDGKVHRAMDEWCREQIVADHPEWVENEFLSSQEREQEVLFSGDGQRIEGMTVEPVDAFRAVLDRWEEGVSEFRTGKRIFRVCFVDKVLQKEIVSFLAAKSKGLLKGDRQLRRLYARVRGERPSEFQDETGQWKPVESVKEAVLRFFFKREFYQVFENEMEQKRAAWVSGQGSLDFGLWNLVRVEKVLALNEEDKTAQLGAWSSLTVPKNGELSFFLIKEWADAGEREFSLHRCEMMREVVDALLSEVVAKQALLVPVKRETDC